MIPDRNSVEALRYLGASRFVGPARRVRLRDAPLDPDPDPPDEEPDDGPLG